MSPATRLCVFSVRLPRKTILRQPVRRCDGRVVMPDKISILRVPPAVVVDDGAQHLFFGSRQD